MHKMQYPDQQIPEISDIVSTMRSYGLPIHFTEFDINTTWLGGSMPEKYRTQAEIARRVITGGLQSGVLRSVYFFRFDDQNNWLRANKKEYQGSGGSAQANATPIDDKGKKKPFYYAVQKAFYKQLSG